MYGANIDAKNDLRGMTPLHIAATRDSLEFCAMLIVRGADASIEDNTGRIAAEYCQQGTQLERLLKLPQGSVEANEFAHFCLQPHTEEEYEEVAAAEEEKEEKAVLELKGEANVFFKAGDYVQALECYAAARKLIGESEESNASSTPLEAEDRGLRCDVILPSRLSQSYFCFPVEGRRECKRRWN